MSTPPRLCLLFAFAILPAARSADPPKPQYEHGKIRIEAASADEGIRKQFSLEHAVDYLLKGNDAWMKRRKCVACHTTGSYLQAAPELSPYIGKPDAEVRDFYLKELAELKAAPKKKFERGTSTAQVVYVASGLAEWDRHVTGKLSAETAEALGFMFQLQNGAGTWQSLDCWPPFESSAYQEATVAAIAMATAPGWLEANADTAGVRKIMTYLRTAIPPHDYGRVLLLWAATRIPKLLDTERTQELVELITSKQRKDGGWSIRSFARPEQWGGGNRAKKLRKEPEFKTTPSDGHMTGLCVMVLRDAGVAADDQRIAKATDWLLNNQRETGRWWTRSLNTDSYHFITYSGTTYPLLALAKCGKLSPLRK